MFQIADVERGALCFTPDVEHAERAIFERLIQKECGQECDAQPGNCGIAHEEAVIDAQAHVSINTLEHASNPKAPICRTPLTIDDGAMRRQILKRVRCPVCL